jgi:OOP family OmpA-OmpF porin
MSAQDAPETTSDNDYNKWSIDVNGGINKPTNPMAPEYNVKAFNFFRADLGFRYMFNTKFGMKLHGGYDVFNSDDNGPEFETKLITVGLQGYANLGRIMEFETWTQRLNLLGHTGVGVGQMTNDRYDGKDHIGMFMIGMTGQFRISDRISLNLDFTMNNTIYQHKTWDGTDLETANPGFDGTYYTGTLGLSIALGKHEKHADWFVDEKSDELEELEKRMADMETMMNDTDKDGVPDYLDSEPNTITGVAVDSKGRTIDTNGNGVPDELESYIESRTAGTSGTSGTSGDGVGLAEMINGGYVNVYFDFNKDQPNAQSVSGINFLIRYLKQNPSVGADVIGYADEIGDTAYNRDLSNRRAQNVRQILIDSGIDGGRLNIVGNGEDSSVNKDNKYARQVVRRVTFQLK